MGHLFLQCGPDVTLVVSGQSIEEWCDVDDVGVGRDGQRLCDLRSNQNVTISFLQMASVVAILVVRGILFLIECRSETDKASKRNCTGGSNNRSASEKGPP